MAKKLETIKSFTGAESALSNEQYRLLKPASPSNLYAKGTLVRLISGPTSIEKVGHHPKRGFRMVCRVDAEKGEYVGVPLKDLQRLVKPKK